MSQIFHSQASQHIANSSVVSASVISNADWHIVLVEDDPAIAMSLKVTFKRENWQVTWLDNASDVMPTLRQMAEDGVAISCIILDVGLPDGDGLSLCQQIRHAHELGAYQTLPIVFLTARSDEVDRILGLEMGADDYCAKPFSPRELVARLKAIWRREQLTTHSMSQKMASQSIEHASSFAQSASQSGDPVTYQLASGNWRYEPKTYTLFWQDTKLELSNTERKLLLAFLNHPHQVFSREQLLGAISEHPDHRLARTIDSHVKSIRKQLAQINTTDVIYTHRGIGYGLCKA